MRIAVFSQDPNKLTRELVAEIGQKIGPCTFVAGKPDSNEEMVIPNVAYLLAPGYKRDTVRSRAISWVAYTLHAFVRALLLIRRTDLFFFVSSPPYIGVVGYFAHLIARKRYVVLVNDIYPDIAENFGMIRSKGVLSKLWRAVNRRVYRHAVRVVTLSEEMARCITDQIGPGNSSEKVVVIPTWVDTNLIRPLCKSDNPFAAEHGQKDKFTIMYAGNLGNAADVAMIPKIAYRLREDPRLHFFLIGRGEKAEQLRGLIQEMNLENITMLPHQPEAVLPSMLAAADISLVMLDPSAKGKSVPSKTYYYMAAGSAILAHCAEGDALESMVNKFDCGVSVQDEAGAVEAISLLARDSKFLKKCKTNSRTVAEKFFSKEKCIAQMIEIFVS